MTTRFPVLLLLAAATPVFGQQPATDRPPQADHHLHVRSEAATDAFLKAMEELEGQSLDGLQPATDAETVLERMDSAGVERGVLLSLGYLFGVPDLEFEGERELVRAENEYVAQQAESAPDRLTAFCGVNPLAEYALDEIERCGGDPRVAGLKLHLANSDVDLRASEDVERLKEVFAAADDHGLAIVVHLYTRHPEYGAEDARTFIHEVLPHASGIPVQVAHLGGPGPIGEATLGAVSAFTEALSGETGVNPEALEDLYFDTAEVPIPLELAQGDEDLIREVEEANALAAQAMRELGEERILFGSDWIIAHDPPRYAAVVDGLPLPEDLRTRIARNTAPYLR